MLPYLRAANYEPHIIFEPKDSAETPDISGLAERISKEGIEIVYFQKVHGPSVLVEAKNLSAAGVRTVYGVCDFVDNEMAKITDATIVVTDFLKGLYDPMYQSKIHVVHDGIERPEFRKHYAGSRRYRREKDHSLRAVLVTRSELYSIPILDPRPRFVDITVIGHYLPNPSFLHYAKKTYWKLCSMQSCFERARFIKGLVNRGFRTINWNIGTVYQMMLRADVGIIPLDMQNDPLPGLNVSQWQLRSENRLTLNMALGLPVIASPVPAYKSVIEQGKNGYIAETRHDWVEYLTELLDPKLRQEMGQRARASVINRFSKEDQARKLIEVLDRIQAVRDQKASSIPLR
jgi:glycosyltransferase involved in cell wall biosynthesis